MKVQKPSIRAEKSVLRSKPQQLLVKYWRPLDLSRGNLIMILGLSVIFSACFNIRQVEPPSSSASNWVSPTDYQILLDNLQLAVNQRNVQNYLRCFEQEELDFEPVASLFN
ncbi:MAG: hypothetical protein AAFQ68_09195, partial [Bacteroidota bacterium]